MRLMLHFCTLTQINALKMKKLVFASLLVFSAMAAYAQEPSFKEGLKQLVNENFSAAQATFTAIAKNDPKNGTIYYYIGEVSYEMEDYPEAEKAYKKGLTINPQCAECKVGIGKLLLDQGKADEAEENFQSAIRLDKKNPEIYALIGEAYLRTKKPNANKAIDYLSTARDMNPAVAWYWSSLGDAYKMANNNGEAMTSYETAIKKDPLNSAAYIAMARIWKGAKQDSLAIPLLIKAIELSPNDARAYKDLIELYIKNGQYDKVTPLLEKYVTLTGDDVDAKVRLVKFLTFQAKDYDRAIEEGEKLLKTNPEQYTLHRWLAWAYAEKGEFEHSYEHSNKLFEALQKNKERATFPSDYDYWGKAAFKLGQIDSSAHIYRKYLELDPSRSQEINGMLAKGYFDAKKYEQAAKYYLLKGAEKPLSVADNYYLGLSYFYLDENVKSDSVFIKVLEVTPDYAPGWMMRARVGNRLDTAETKLYLPKVPYENYIKYAAADPVKNKRNLMEAYKYLGWYYVQKEDNVMAKEYYDKALELDPADKETMDIIAILKGQR